MMTTLTENFKTLDFELLSSVEGGGRRASDAILNGTSGAVEGLLICGDSGLLVVPYGVFACAAGGAALGMMFPH